MNKYINKTHIIEALIITIVIIGCFRFTIWFYHYNSNPEKRQSYITKMHVDDTLRIAYIGDSWAYGHKCHKCAISSILKDRINRPVIVESYGICGLTSKEIYYALYDLDNFRLFMRKGYNYCFISAGINDTQKKMSTSYYQHSINCIIHFMQANNIFPIILEIPDYNILKVYNELNLRQKIIRQFSMIVNGTRMDCRQQYREALDELIKSNNYEERVGIIRYLSWNNDYENDLKNKYIRDGFHLNEKGYLILDSLIAKEILSNFSYKHRQ
ncbi:MAG: SGNH/GDSL hydrolase family protein [Prevotella sp.]|nr:SGNH/GDSL hydrolase family protein [Prevotella sp.]